VVSNRKGHSSKGGGDAPIETDRPRRRARREEKRIVPLELFYDLVFAFAITQVSHLLLADLSWAGAGRALLALLVVWWAWNYTVWVTSEVDLGPILVRLLFLAMMLASLAMAVAVPEAFGRYGLLFAGSYVAIKTGRLLFLTIGGAHASATGPGRGTRLLTWFLVSGVLWLAGGVADGPARTALWGAALALDLTGPLVMYWIPGRPRLPFGLWRVELRHLAERFELFTLIAFGEMIVLTGATASALGFDGPRSAAFALAFLSTASMYWLYFDDFPTIAKGRLEPGPAGIHLARDAYMYLHVILVAGVILSAVGDRLVIADPTDRLTTVGVVSVAAGPAVYLLGHVLFRLRVAGSVSWERLGGAVACVLVGLIGTVVPALALSALLVCVLVVVIATETLTSAQSSPSG
jgi:low temperature requirement protein LtrA